MSTATLNPPATLGDAAQALIDSRLDTIERMLMGQMPRGERLAIVREVEAQLHDLLAERNPDDTDRDAVITALGRLDPPEAYLPDEGGIPRTARPGAERSAVSTVPVRSTARPQRYATAGKVGGILGIVSAVLLLPLAFDLYMIFGEGSDIALYLLFALEFVLGLTTVLAIIFSGYSRLRSGWAIVGLTSGIIASFFAAGGAGLIVMDLLGLI